MTEAEKMRKAAADWCAGEADSCDDAAKWGGHRKYVQDCKAAAYALRNACSKIRSLPIEASAPAADCQQAGLVTVGAGLLDEVKAALREIIKTDRIYGVTFGSGEREVWHDGDSGVIARAALARLEREVG